ncbi:DUF2345 domain-containing protein, partial [Vreelandella olivaria]|uniref:DUF2345 domain-containing protein n=1 Tax=Vreelandella olivaria TaxID=390919 RepID=UPI00201F74C5
HHTVHGNRFEHTEGQQHFTLQGSLHIKAGQAWLSESGRELHIKAGHKVVLEASDELTLNAGGSFIKLEGGGITLVGPKVRINAGGSPGNGTGQAVEGPLLPGHVAAEVHEKIVAPQQTRTKGVSLAEASGVGEREFLVDVTSGRQDGQQVRLRKGWGRTDEGQNA